MLLRGDIKAQLQIHELQHNESLPTKLPSLAKSDEMDRRKGNIWRLEVILPAKYLGEKRELGPRLAFREIGEKRAWTSLRRRKKELMATRTTAASRRKKKTQPSGDGSASQKAVEREAVERDAIRSLSMNPRNQIRSR